MKRTDLIAHARATLAHLRQVSAEARRVAREVQLRRQEAFLSLIARRRRR